MFLFLYPISTFSINVPRKQGHVVEEIIKKRKKTGQAVDKDLKSLE